MTNNYYFDHGATVSVMPKDGVKIGHELPPRVYTINCDPMTGVFSLVKSPDMDLPKKFYGNIIEHADRIYNSFKVRDSSTGVLLSGLKGTGKTLLAKYLSRMGQKDGYATILVNEAYQNVQGFMKFLQSIDVPSIVIFDEFEKTYAQTQQEEILTLLDGVFNSKKLYILTCNKTYLITDHIFNRPGRVFYNIAYDGLTLDFVKEYCDDNLKEPQHFDSIMRVFKLYSEINFDMVQAIVEEVNRYKRAATDLINELNISPAHQEDSTYEIIALTVDGKPVGHFRKEWQGNISSEEIEIYARIDEDGDFEYYNFTLDNLVDTSRDGFLTFVSGDMKVVMKEKAVYAFSSAYYM